MPGGGARQSSPFARCVAPFYIIAPKPVRPDPSKCLKPVDPIHALPRRLRRLHRVWPDPDGNIAYLITVCVQGRAPVLDNVATLDRFERFLLDSPTRYQWFGRRYVLMPDHIHLIARQGATGVRLGEWMKAMKAVVAGLEARASNPCGEENAGKEHRQQYGGPDSTLPDGSARFVRTRRTWRWQSGFHDHKLRSAESEARKWEYICLNPVRAGLVTRPEDWLFGGEIFHDGCDAPRVIRGTPLLLETGMLIKADDLGG